MTSNDSDHNLTDAIPAVDESVNDHSKTQVWNDAFKPMTESELQEFAKSLPKETDLPPLREIRQRLAPSASETLDSDDDAESVEFESLVESIVKWLHARPNKGDIPIRNLASTALATLGDSPFTRAELRTYLFAIAIAIFRVAYQDCQTRILAIQQRQLTSSEDTNPPTKTSTPDTSKLLDLAQNDPLTAIIRLEQVEHFLLNNRSKIEFYLLHEFAGCSVSEIVDYVGMPTNEVQSAITIASFEIDSVTMLHRQDER